MNLCTKLFVHHSYEIRVFYEVVQLQKRSLRSYT